jgi:hypothetical protein
MATAAIAAAAPAIAVASPISADPIFAAIDEHRKANAAHLTAIDELAQTIAADRPEPGAAFAGLPVNAVAH